MKIDRLKDILRGAGLVAVLLAFPMLHGCVSFDKQFASNLQESLEETFDPAVEFQFANDKELLESEKEAIRRERRTLQGSIDAITGEKHELPRYSVQTPE